MSGGHEEPQNIYDDPGFFAGYSTLERFGAGWERAVEHADLLGLLPDVHGRRVLDLGCGAGQLAHHLATHGAAEVIGIDVSEKMLALARAEWAHPAVTYRRQAIEDAAFPASRFDLVVSSLAFHYVDDYRGLVARIAEWLAPGGILVYSTEHPIFTARATGDGWALDGAGRRMGWGVDRYAEEGAREETWFVQGVRKVHRMLATLINGLLEAGLAVERVVEERKRHKRALSVRHGAGRARIHRCPYVQRFSGCPRVTNKHEREVHRDRRIEDGARPRAQGLSVTEADKRNAPTFRHQSG